ncbi:carboxylating nicotinate-nucleotide diphosphorylase [Luteimonas sp. e5]
MNVQVFPPHPAQVAEDVHLALVEDVGAGDVTADLLPDEPAEAYLLCKEDAVIAGRPWFDATHQALDRAVRIDWRIDEGDRVPANTVIATLHGRSRALVSAERVALNFLQTLSGTATVTAAFVAAVAGTGTRILDTRKTLPGLRLAQKYAVRVGGGDNHRIGLFDAMMLKENHIRAFGSLAGAVKAARGMHPGLPLIVEVETVDELREALHSGCDRVLIDDFDAATRREAVRIAHDEFGARIPLEVSGGVDLDGIRAIAADGVDCISIGALTKHVRAVDLSMKLGPPPGIAVHA